jgi:hypothetical protein
LGFKAREKNVFFIRDIASERERASMAMRLARKRREIKESSV